MEKNTQNNVINLLWSGGLDSTYRLLEIVFENNQMVQPYYTKDSTRLSMQIELKTMEEIKQLIFEKSPEAQNLIKPTQFFNLNDIPENDTISKSFYNLKEYRHIGHQYDWLARFCDWKGLYNLELGVIKKGEVSKYGESLSQSFAPFLKELDKNCFVFDEDLVKASEHQKVAKLYFEIFKYYRFPIIHLSKKDMVNLANEKGWKSIIDKTWFCHRPINNRPCGKCNPCRTAVCEGLGHTIPISKRLIFNLKTWLGVYWVKRKIKKG